MSNPLDKWPDFMDSCWTRMEAGQREYGDKSFRRPVGEIVHEIEEELFDVCNWAFIAYCRIQDAKDE